MTLAELRWVVDRKTKALRLLETQAGAAEAELIEWEMKLERAEGQKPSRKRQPSNGLACCGAGR